MYCRARYYIPDYRRETIVAKERKDYCGPDWLHPKLRRLLSGKFNASCKIHDLDYGSKKYSRSEADRRFREHTLRQAGNSLLWKVVAKFFYYMVRIGGRISYGKNKG